MTYPAPTPPHPGQDVQFPLTSNSAADGITTPQREMAVVIDRIHELEENYRASIHARASRLHEQQERFSDLQSAVESHSNKYKQEIRTLKSQLRKSEQKQAVMARRLAQTLQERNEDEASHLHQLIRMHDEQIATMQEGMRELLHTLGVEESVIGNLENLCGVSPRQANTNGQQLVVSMNGHGKLQQQQEQHQPVGKATEEIMYDIRRQNCELAISLRKAISIVREKLDVEEQARADAQRRAMDAMDAAAVVEQALHKAGAILLKEEMSMMKYNGGKVEAVSVPAHNATSASNGVNQSSSLHHHHQQQSFAQHSYHGGHETQQQHLTESLSPAHQHAAMNNNNNNRRISGGPLYAPNRDDVFRARSVSGGRGDEQGSSQSPPPRSKESRRVAPPMMMFSQPQQPAAATAAINGSTGMIAVPSRLASSLAVLKDIVFGSLDVVKDIQKIVDRSGNDSVNTTVADTQIAIDRARAAERAIAGQALLELRREVDAHQHTRIVLQKRITFLSSQYEKMLQAASTFGGHHHHDDDRKTAAAAVNRRTTTSVKTTAAADDEEDDAGDEVTGTDTNASQLDGGPSRSQSMAALAATLNVMQPISRQQRQEAAAARTTSGAAHDDLGTNSPSPDPGM